ncbi:hypothetical protein TanjilG_25795 [Lupinus angustifolius]|uniref:Uncharacterized protein n=1 Tax=Lupinus angustifolius TaxID=3871 RepID=A0A1J7HZS7_LUPAN|nr:PREDICTED: uncharacterized protein LOC109347824 [Lupinus angustifolius]OIW11882.1 hypothetical protein TanjilG_25795 [Lupinus angustifolius]
MESTEQRSDLLHRILPPRLEDAGLEDCALPPESIHQAFLKAATAVKHIFSDDDSDCLNNPSPGEDASDVLIGIEPEIKPPPGPCGVEKGCESGGDEVKVVGGGGGGGGEVEDEVVVVGEGRGVKLGEGGESCVDELKGLGIKDDDVVEDDDDDKEKKPNLVEGFV